MHVYMASGGIAQWHLNALLRSFLAEGFGFSLAKLDEFGSQVQFPKTVSRLRGSFFQDRYVEKGVAHLKCFASECWLALSVLILFCSVVVERRQIMAEHVSGLKLLKSILEPEALPTPSDTMVVVVVVAVVVVVLFQNM